MTNNISFGVDIRLTPGKLQGNDLLSRTTRVFDRLKRLSDQGSIGRVELKFKKGFWGDKAYVEVPDSSAKKVRKILRRICPSPVQRTVNRVLRFFGIKHDFKELEVLPALNITPHSPNSVRAQECSGGNTVDVKV